jgi:hypothetical protein
MFLPRAPCFSFGASAPNPIFSFAAPSLHKFECMCKKSQGCFSSFESLYVGKVQLASRLLNFRVPSVCSSIVI